MNSWAVLKALTTLSNATGHKRAQGTENLTVAVSNLASTADERYNMIEKKVVALAQT